MFSYFLGIGIGVKMTSRKSIVKKKTINFSIPNPRSLLKALEIYLKVEIKARVILNIVKGLFHVNLFLQIPMQEDE
jgi:hypothetical protein